MMPFKRKFMEKQKKVSTPEKRLCVVQSSPTTFNNCNTSAIELESVAQGILEQENISDEENGTRIGDIFIPSPLPESCSTDYKGSRLIIYKIENKNFKSYAGTVILGPFHHCFTTIIGPNGSGKSNVIDSMLFVFGYRANKIRCKKVSTLLHNSARYPNMSMCSVAVHFREIIDREDGFYKEVPNSDIIVERTAFRDNTSFYTINGQRVQFKEVSKLLKAHNVDLDHNRFLILQGEVESIAMMKPKGQNENDCGMLEYMEDIIGTARYKEPLLKINTRVEKLTEERTEKHNRCKLAEREMKDLEQPYSEAVDYLRKENENTRTKNLRIQKYLSEKLKKLEEYKVEFEKIEVELKEHDLFTEKLRKDREEKEELIKNEIVQLDNLRKEKEKIEKLWETANKNFTEVQQAMNMTNKRRKQNKIQREKLREESLELQKIPSRNQKDMDECEKKLEKLIKEKQTIEEELQRNYVLVEKQTKPIIEKREKLQTELLELTKRVDDAKSSLIFSESELKILKHDETSEIRKYESMKSSYEEFKLSLEEKKTNLNEIKNLLPAINEDIILKTTQLKENQHEEQKMRSILMDIKTKINEKVENLQVTRSNNKVLDFLMRLKSEGKIPGVLGRLGDLGAIDSKYDVAISTACGRLDDVVVDTVNTAQECIAHLKHNDIGRATFIALEKVKHFGKQIEPIETPENVPRLFDLVYVEDDRVLPAFYFALRNTLVSNDLEQGTRIAFGKRRYRIVTLNGDVIEISGTMSGGGRSQISGKMGTKIQVKTNQCLDSSMVSQKALEDMQINAEKIQSQINYTQEEQGRLEKEILHLKNKKQKLEAETQKVTITIKSLSEQLPRIFKQLEAQRKRMNDTTTDEEKLKHLVDIIKEKQQKLQLAEEATQELNNKIITVKNEINNIHEDKIKPLQSKIDALGTQVTKLNKHISKLKVEVSTSERNLTKIEKQMDQLSENIIEAQNEIVAMSAKRQQFDDETTQLVTMMEEIQSKVDNAKGESSEIQKKIIQLEKREGENTIKRVEIDERLQTVAAKMSDVRSQIPHWRDKLKPLRLHEIPGDMEPQVPLKIYSEEELSSHTLQDIQYKESVQEELLKKKPNLSCIHEFIEKRNIYLERVKVLEDITSKRNEMRHLYDDLRKKRYNEFMRGFKIITRKLKEMYQMITQGGDAELELVDSMDPFTEGVTFSVRPPKKTWKNISNLSGGEKTLSSLALVFALHYYKPSPLYFMDEIDAALDFKNISIVAHYIKERTKNAQFIIISLRSNMFELSDYVVGIYKVKDCTDAVTIRNVSESELESAEVPTQLHTQTMTDLPNIVNKTFLQTTVENRNNASYDQNLKIVPCCKKIGDTQIIQDSSPSHNIPKPHNKNNSNLNDFFKKPLLPQNTIPKT